MDDPVAIAYSQAGRIAYEAYVEQAGGVSLATGATLPVWDRLGDPIRSAWAYSARAVLEANTLQRSHGESERLGSK